jgi:hypothetical protein
LSGFIGVAIIRISMDGNLNLKKIPEM